MKALLLNLFAPLFLFKKRSQRGVVSRQGVSHTQVPEQTGARGDVSSIKLTSLLQLSLPRRRTSRSPSIGIYPAAGPVAAPR
eukprot:1176189-Prorocentrum_minimum.AAC.1